MNVTQFVHSRVLFKVERKLDSLISSEHYLKVENVFSLKLSSTILKLILFTDYHRKLLNYISLTALFLT